MIVDDDLRAEREIDARAHVTHALSEAVATDDLGRRAFFLSRARRSIEAMRTELEQLDAFVRAEEAEVRRRRETAAPSRVSG